MLTEFLTVMFRDDGRHTPNFQTATGNTRLFKKVSKYVFNALNAFCVLLSKLSLHVDFSKGECGSTLNELFTEARCSRLLDLRYLHSIY